MSAFARVVFVLSGVSVAFASPTYSVQSLGLLGPGASSISAGGAGYYTSASGNQTPAVFTLSGVDVLSGIGMASGENASGLVVGTTYSGSSPSVTEWLNGRSWTLFGGYGTAVNNSGQIAGGYLAGDNSLHAFVETGTTVRDLGVLTGNWSSAAALNATGQAAGTSSASGGVFHSFFWDGSMMRDLGTLGGASSNGNGLNDQGIVAGASQTATGYLHAFVSSDRGLVDLGTLGGTTSAAYAINDSGEVVGYSFTSGNGETHAFLDYNGVMTDLNSLLPIGSGWTVTGAYAIDNQGEILGTALHDGELFGVELFQNTSAAAAVTGAPEPRALALAAVGFIAFAVMGKRTSRAKLQV